MKPRFASGSSTTSSSMPGAPAAAPGLVPVHRQRTGRRQAIARLRQPARISSCRCWRCAWPAFACARSVLGKVTASTSFLKSVLRHELIIRRVRLDKLATLLRKLMKSPSRPVRRLTVMGSFGSDPGSLQAEMYIPENFRKDGPLVVVLHGSMQTAESYNYGSGWSTLADDHGFALLFPQQRRSNNALRSFNWFRRGDSGRGFGDPCRTDDLCRLPLPIVQEYLAEVRPDGAERTKPITLCRMIMLMLHKDR